MEHHSQESLPPLPSSPARLSPPPPPNTSIGISSSPSSSPPRQKLLEESFCESSGSQLLDIGTISCPESFCDDQPEKCSLAEEEEDEEVGHEARQRTSSHERLQGQGTYTLEEIDEEEDATKLSEMTDSSKSMIVYKDTATWTAEDGMPSPVESSSPLESPSHSHEALIASHRISDFHLLPLEANEIRMVESGVSGGAREGTVPPPPQFESVPPAPCSLPGHHRHHKKSSKHHHHHHHHHGHSRQRSEERESYGKLSHHHHSHASQQHHLSHAHHQPCFTVSSHLTGRETRLYENVPRTAAELEQLGALLNDIPPAGGDELLGQRVLISRPRSHHHGGKDSCGGGGHKTELLNVADLLMGAATTTNTTSSAAGPGSSRNSWADSGRESLSFDGEGGNGHNGGGGSSSNGSSKNILLYPAPPPPTTSTSAGVTTSSSFCYMTNISNVPSSAFLSPSPPPQQQSRNFNGNNNVPSTKRHKRDRHLVRQKHAIDESSEKALKEDDLNFSHMYIPSPRRSVPAVSSGSILAPPSVSNFVNPSPINLQRHPNTAQMMLQENKRCRPLIPCESPYIISPSEWPGNTSHSAFPKSGRKSPTRGGNGSGVGGYGGADRFRGDSQGNKEYFHGSGRPLMSGKSHHGSSTSGRHHQSFDYGELPSHQMFPKRHLLHQGVRHFSQHHFPKDNPEGNANNPGSGGNQPNTFQPNSHLQPPPPPNLQHRSFPAGLFSGIAPRSCSMGDLTSANGINSALGSSSKCPDPMPISGPGMAQPALSGYNSSNMPLVASLPLPPATSVTYEFSLAPVSGSLAPGWHLTAVQRGLANAVPLAAVVARRRLPRPRTSTRARFGFTDKNEARRAKWTIVVTALALLAMSMLLVGVTLRLAPLIDDLVRKENEHLLKVIHATSSLNETMINGGGASVTTTTASDRNSNSSIDNINPSFLDDEDRPPENQQFQSIQSNISAPLISQSSSSSQHNLTHQLLPKAQSLIMSALIINNANVTTIHTRTTSPQAPPTITPYFTRPISSISPTVDPSSPPSSRPPPAILINEQIKYSKATHQLQTISPAPASSQ